MQQEASVPRLNTFALSGQVSTKLLLYDDKTLSAVFPLFSALADKLDLS
jgi:hypothetical protein